MRYGTLTCGFRMSLSRISGFFARPAETSQQQQQHDPGHQQCDHSRRSPAPGGSFAEAEQNADQRERQQYRAGQVQPAGRPMPGISYEPTGRSHPDDDRDNSDDEKGPPGGGVNADQRAQQDAAADPDPDPVAGVDRADRELRALFRHGVAGNRLRERQHRELRSH